MARTQYGTTWWGRRWLDALSGIDYANRIPRGKSYANTGKVYDLELDPVNGLVTARVLGHFDPYYKVRLELPLVSLRDEQRFIEAIASAPLILARLAARELDPSVFDLAESLNIHVFPRRWSDLKVRCSCPDHAVPCKHIAAVIYKLSQEIDANPFVLFALRGIDILAGLEERGIRLGQTQQTEMPRWSELITRPDSAEPLPLTALNALSYSSVELMTEALAGLFTDTPAGYTEGSLKELLFKTLDRAQRTAAKLLKDSTDRDLPAVKDGPWLTVSPEGELISGAISWKLHLPGKRPQTCRAADLPDLGYVCEMFSGAIEPQRLESAPEQTEAFYQLWLIALKLVLSGSLMPQIFEPQSGTLAVRWIPAVIVPKVKAVTRCAGQSLLSLPTGVIEVQQAVGPLPALALGELVLSWFLGSFIKQAYHYVKKHAYDDNPDRAALFLGQVIDLNEYVDGDAVKKRLEAWLSPLFLDALNLKPVVVLSDDSRGQLEDFVDKRRSGQLLPEDETSEEEAAAEDPAAPSADTWFDGRTDLKALDQAVLNESTAETAEDRFANHRGVGIAMGFKQGSGLNGTVSLKEILSSERYAPVRFECLRTVSRLGQICPPLLSLLKNHGGSGTVALADLAPLLNAALPALRLLGVELIVPRSLTRVLRPKAALSLSLDSSYTKSSGLLGLERLLSFDWMLTLGNQRISRHEFEELCRRAGQIVRFGKEFVYVDPNEVQRIAKHLEQSGSTLRGSELMRAALSGSCSGSSVLLTPALKETLTELLKQQELPPPRSLNAVLRPYQERGYSWLARNIKLGMGSIIADDMGLGKTLQVIAALDELREAGELKERGALIVVPTSLLVNWTRELKRFAPELSFKLIYGKDRSFEPHTDLTLTTYGVLRTELAAFKKRSWRVLVIDEAQAIKNHTSQSFKAVRSVPADACIAMSGTPVENRLMEYWSIMDFVNPGLLGSAAVFKREFAEPIEREHSASAISRFKQVTAPFILRRLKTDKSVISDLPDKNTVNRFCSLTPEQTALYEEVTQQALKTLEQQEKKARSGLILNLIGTLKQICNSPEQYQERCPYHGPEYSGKAQALFEILDNLFAARRKVLIFTQFRRTGQLLCSWIEERYGFKPDFLSGETPLAERTRMVDSFSTERSRRALVLSLKAAGTGLNLTAATAVVHFDLWWNPAVESQATDRAYRIGQQQQVDVYRLICADTFEEHVNALIDSKKELSELTVGEGEQWLGNLSDRQLKEIFTLAKAEPDEAAAEAAAKPQPARRRKAAAS